MYNRRRDQAWLFKEKGAEDPKEKVVPTAKKAPAPLANKEIKDEEPR